MHILPVFYIHINRRGGDRDKFTYCLCKPVQLQEISVWRPLYLAAFESVRRADVNRSSVRFFVEEDYRAARLAP